MAKDDIEFSGSNAMVTISTANSNLDGTGTLGTVITGINNGIRINRVIIKATGDVTQGMVRLFLYDGTNTRLIEEVPVETVDQRAVTPAFTGYVDFSAGLFLPLNWVLKASTQNAESFNIIAEGVSWDYPVSSTKMELTAASATTTVSTANSNLDGTGTLSTLITASDNGLKINSISIKAVGNVTLGVIRLFLYDGSNTKLFQEIPVPESEQFGDIPSFFREIKYPVNFHLKSGWSIKVSTENAETFVITAEAESWDYV